MRIVNLNCGNKWDSEFLDTVIELNKKYEENAIRVNELYGNPQDQFLSGVRPDARIPKLLDSAIVKYIRKAVKHKIEINITLNKSCLGIIKDVDLKSMQKRVDFYQAFGVTRFTIFSPYLLRELSFNKAEISTIHNNCNVSYMAALCRLNKNIDKICLPIYINRNFRLVKKCSEVLPKPELVVNEFCVSDKNICYYRTECYNIQSHNQNIEYPFKQCSEYREKYPIAWLKAPFILPQWLVFYTDLFDIWHFKLTGRTHAVSSIIKTIEHYLKRDYKGPIHKLWGEGLPYQDLKASKQIMAEDLDQKAFFHKFMMKKYTCDSEVCGEECNHCADILGGKV